MKRYDVRQAQLDPTVGSEIAKTRPVVIVSLDVFNEMLETVTVCPLTSALRPTWRTRPAVRIARKPAELAGHCSERRILTGKLFSEERVSDRRNHRSGCRSDGGLHPCQHRSGDSGSPHTLLTKQLPV